MSGSYEAEISRRNPGCIVFLLDQSGSMKDPFNGDLATPKANAAADEINKLLQTLIVNSVKNTNEGPRHYFDIGVIGYGADGKVAPCLPDATGETPLVPVSELANKRLRVERRPRMVPDGKGGHVESTIRVPIWFDPIAGLGTPMREAFQYAGEQVASWAAAHRDSFPPIVVNITDGEPNTDPTAEARKLSEITTRDGRALLYNIHLPGAKQTPVKFPANASALPDKFSKMLFEISSVLPDKAKQDLAAEGYPTEPGARGFIFNADPIALVKFLEVGTRTTKLEDGPWDR
jgi:uncharacterized protein YegL